MHKSFLLLLLISTLSGLLFAPEVWAQQTPAERFNQVQVLSSEEKYEEAIAELKLLISEYPHNLDYQIQLGRIFAWAGRYQDSELVLLPIVADHPDKEEAFSALLNTKFWAGDFEKAIELANTGIKRFPNNKFEYQFIQLQAYQKSGSVKEALALADTLRETSPDNSSIKFIQASLLKKQKNRISISYSNTYFPSGDFDPWHLGSISYTRNWVKMPSEFRLSYANIFNRNDMQFDMNLYPVTGAHSYLFLNAGIAPSHEVFPFVRGALEYFYEFENGIGFSAGGRILKFSEETVPILTVHAGKTISDFNIQYRPLFVIEDNDFFPTHTFAVRKNWLASEAFLQLDLQYGSAPYFLFFSEELDRVSSKRIGIQSQIRAAKYLLIRFKLMYENEEYSPGNFRNRLNSQMILHTRF